MLNLVIMGFKGLTFWRFRYYWLPIFNLRTVTVLIEWRH